MSLACARLCMYHLHSHGSHGEETHGACIRGPSLSKSDWRVCVCVYTTYVSFAQCALVAGGAMKGMAVAEHSVLASPLHPSLEDVPAPPVARPAFNLWQQFVAVVHLEHPRMNVQLRTDPKVTSRFAACRPLTPGALVSSSIGLINDFFFVQSFDDSSLAGWVHRRHVLLSMSPDFYAVYVSLEAYDLMEWIVRPGDLSVTAKLNEWVPEQLPKKVVKDMLRPRGGEKVTASQAAEHCAEGRIGYYALDLGKMQNTAIGGSLTRGSHITLAYWAGDTEAHFDVVRRHLTKVLSDWISMRGKPKERPEALLRLRSSGRMTASTYGELGFDRERIRSDLWLLSSEEVSALAASGEATVPYVPKGGRSIEEELLRLRARDQDRLGAAAHRADLLDVQTEDAPMTLSRPVGGLAESLEVVDLLHYLRDALLFCPMSLTEGCMMGPRLLHRDSWHVTQQSTWVSVDKHSPGSRWAVVREYSSTDNHPDGRGTQCSVTSTAHVPS